MKPILSIPSLNWFVTHPREAVHVQGENVANQHFDLRCTTDDHEVDQLSRVHIVFVPRQVTVQVVPDPFVLKK